MNKQIKRTVHNQQGFTLVELMVVIIILGILVAIALPNFIGAADRAKVAQVKGNIKVVQTMMETFAVESGGVYPRMINELKTDAEAKGYYKAITNPYSGSSNWQLSIVLPGGGAVTQLAAVPVMASNFFAGKVAMKVQAAARPTRYDLFGFTGEGEVIKDKGQIFLASND